MTGRRKSKVALVTGAAGGLDRAVAGLYAKEGAVVYALDMLGDEVVTLADEPGDIRENST